jgi:branched-chain amino acid transport system substrate-binding protein
MTAKFALITRKRVAASVLCCLTLIIVRVAQAEPVRVGVIVPLSGSAAASGETIRRSIELAAEKFNRDSAVQFIFEDDQLQPKNTVTAAQRLLDEQKVSGLIVFGTPTSLAVAGIAEQRKVPMLAFTILEKVVAGRSYVVKHWVTSRAITALVQKEVLKRGYKKVAIVSSINDAMLALKDQFTDNAVVEISYEAEIPREDLDFKTVISRIVKTKPDAVYNLLWAPQPGLFAKQLRAAGYKGPMFGYSNLEDPNEIKVAEGALDGTWLASGDDSAGDEYYNLYQQRFGKRPAAGGSNAYDAAHLFIRGVRSGALNNYLHSAAGFTGAFGTYDASGQNDFTIKPIIKKIEDGNIK